MRFVVDIPDTAIINPDPQANQKYVEAVLKAAFTGAQMTVSTPTIYDLDLAKLEDLAIRYCGSDEIEVDPLHPGDISPGEDGIWVRAWVFLDNEYLADHDIRNPEGVYEDEDEEA